MTGKSANLITENSEQDDLTWHGMSVCGQMRDSNKSSDAVSLPRSHTNPRQLLRLSEKCETSSLLTFCHHKHTLKWLSTRQMTINTHRLSFTWWEELSVAWLCLDGPPAAVTSTHRGVWECAAFLCTQVRSCTVLHRGPPDGGICRSRRQWLGWLSGAMLLTAVCGMTDRFNALSVKASSLGACSCLWSSFNKQHQIPRQVCLCTCVGRARCMITRWSSRRENWTFFFTCMFCLFRSAEYTVLCLSHQVVSVGGMLPCDRDNYQHNLVTLTTAKASIFD